VKKINKYKIKPKKDPCGLLRELYNSKNISIAHDIVTGKARKHKHKNMEEIYYVEKGEGKLHLGNKVIKLKKGDLIAIPKNTWHCLEKIKGKRFEVLVITHPKYDRRDLIFKD